MTKYSNIDQQCVYNDIKVLSSSSFKTSARDCLKCKCTKEGLQHCDFDFTAGVVGPPEGCTAYNDACHLVFVNKDNISEICHELKSINRL